MNVYDCWVKKYGKVTADEKWKARNEKLSKSHKKKNKKLTKQQRLIKFGRPGNTNGMYGKSVHDVWVAKYGKHTADEMLLHTKEKQSKLLKGINIGGDNCMKRSDVVSKMKKTRKETLKNPVIIKKYSDGTKKAWEDGKFDNVNVGRCKWFEYTCSNSENVKVQGTWELAYVTWLDANNIKFIAHRGRIPYKLNGVNKNYYPDFYLIDSDEYIDIKNEYHYSLQVEKFEAIKNCNPHLKIRLIFKEELEKLGCL